MENTALKMSSKELIEEFKEAHGNTDLLRVFLITGSADISRSYELVSKWAKNATGSEDKANFNTALKILQQFELKRIVLTNIVYNASDLNLHELSLPEENEPIQANETEENKTILMLPKLDDTLERVRTMLRVSRVVPEGNEDTVAAEAIELLRATVGQGKVINADGKPTTWDEEDINIFIDANKAKPAKQEKVESKFGFETIYGLYDAMIKNGKEEPEIKAALKEALMGKTIQSRDAESDIIIKDEKVFEDYYTRILVNLVTLGITAQKNKKAEPVVTGKLEEIAAKAEAEVKPFLEAQEKDPTQTSLAATTKKLQAAYKNLGVQKSLRDLFFDVKTLAEKWAPGLAKRNKTTNKDNAPIIPKVETTKMSVEGPSIEIYDDSHNIKESNKPLWAEVEKFTILNDVFTKAQELYKAGNWKDALSMSIILITEGKIKETESSKETIKWDTDQVKQWFHTIVEASVTGEVKKTIDVKAEVVKDKSAEAKATAVKNEEEKKVVVKGFANDESKKEGPVATAGTIDSKENLARLLKDNNLWKDKYTFKSFPVRTNHYRGGAMSLEIVDATNTQEPDLLITEHNMTKFLDEQRDRLVVRRNEEKDVRNLLKTKLSEYYEITSSECKRIVGKLVEEADELRREAKKVERANKPAETTIPAPEVIETPEHKEEPEVKSEPEVNTTPAPEVKEEEVKETVPPTPPAEVKNEPSLEPVFTENNTPENTDLTETTDKPAGESPSSSNEQSSTKLPYDGFEAILNAKKKFQFHVEIYNKVAEYKTSEEGIKAVYDIIDQARKDAHYKKSFVHNLINSMPVDVLSTINNAYSTGVEHAKISEQ